MALFKSMSVTHSGRGVAAWRANRPLALARSDQAGTMVWLRGEHDLTTRSAVSETLARAAEFDGATLVVDMSGVEFLDAGTVGVIVQVSEVLRTQSRSLEVRSPSRCTRRIFELCGLHHLLSPEGDRRLGPAAALATWIAVPAIQRVDSRDDPSWSGGSRGAPSIRAEFVRTSPNANRSGP